jgi:GT2 family glycosyltransferase
MKPLIKVIIVTYNSTRSITACLGALTESTKNFGLDITIVDSASSDDTVILLEAQPIPRVQIIALKENVGYAGGNNVALRAIKDYKAYAAILIINPDILLPAGTLDYLVALLQSDARIGMVSPAIYPFQGATTAETSAQLKKRRSLWGGKGAIAWVEQPGLANVFRVDRLPGCCLLAKPALFEKVGWFDENYFLYWEELDLCLRARRAGYYLLVCADILIQHNAGETERSHRIYYMARNQFYYALKNYNRPLALLFLLRRLLLTNSREFFRFWRSGRGDLLRAGWAGLKAGIKRETGPASIDFD